MTTKEERIYYSDANGVRIGTINAVFGRYKYGVRNIESATMVRQQVTRWPGYMVLLAGAAFMAYGFLFGPMWIIVGVAGIASGTINLSRKKDTYAVRLVTNKGPVLVLASGNKGYIATVIERVHKAMASVRAPTVGGTPSTSA